MFGVVMWQVSAIDQVNMRKYIIQNLVESEKHYVEILEGLLQVSFTIFIAGWIP